MRCGVSRAWGGFEGRAGRLSFLADMFGDASRTCPFLSAYSFGVCTFAHYSKTSGPLGECRSFVDSEHRFSSSALCLASALHVETTNGGAVRRRSLAVARFTVTSSSLFPRYSLFSCCVCARQANSSAFPVVSFTSYPEQFWSLC